MPSKSRQLSAPQPQASSLKIILRASLLFLKFTRVMSRAPSRFLMVLTALSSLELFAEPFFLPREDFWVTDGLVLTVLETNGVVYLGGEFSFVSPSRGSGVSIDIASGTPNRAFPEVNGTVFAVAPDGSGGWFIGGPFTAVGGVPREGIAHIRQDNTVDTNWNANLPAGLIYTIAASGQNVFVGGSFNFIGGQPRENLAALTAAHGEATDWTADANNDVMTLAVSGNTIYAGGIFTQVGGQPRSRLVAVDTRTGQITPWNPSADGEVNALSIVPCDLSGALEHKDSMGNGRVIRAGDVQYMAAGTGVQPSEFNPSKDEAVHLLQIWIQPDRKGVAPRYAEKSLKDAASETLHLVTSKTGRDGSIAIHQDADLWLAKLDPGNRVRHELAPGRHAWLHVAEGEVSLNGKTLGGGDAAAVNEEGSMEVSAAKPAQVLLFDLN